MDLDNGDTWKRNNCEICYKIYLLVWGLEGIVKFTLKRIFKISKHTLSRRLVPGASGKRSFKQKMRIHKKLLNFVTSFVKHHKHNNGQMAFLNTNTWRDTVVKDPP